MENSVGFAQVVPTDPPQNSRLADQNQNLSKQQANGSQQISAITKQHHEQQRITHEQVSSFRTFVCLLVPLPTYVKSRFKIYYIQNASTDVAGELKKMALEK